MVGALLALALVYGCGGVDDTAGTETDSAAASLRACSPARIAELLAPASPGSGSIDLACSVRLDGPGHVITKQIHFRGPAASNQTLDCHGSTIGTGDGLVHVAAVKDGSGTWQRPENVTVRNCKVLGGVVITGMDAHDELLSSRQAGHTLRSQLASPKGVFLDNLQITVTQGSALYVAAGTEVTLSNSDLSGDTDASGIYLSKETGHHRIFNNRIHMNSSNREQIAVDGSAYNWIANNYFAHLDVGGIFVYRNCGETSPSNRGTPNSGTIRHQRPHHNQFVNNTFYYHHYTGSNPAIWLGSRAGNKSYCNDDVGYPFGSSISDLDYATENDVVQNQFFVRDPREMIVAAALPNAALNYVAANELVTARIHRDPGCVVDYGTHKGFVAAGQTAAGQRCIGKTIQGPTVALPMNRYFLGGVGHTVGADGPTPTFDGRPYAYEHTFGWIANLPASVGSWTPLYLCQHAREPRDLFASTSGECEHAGGAVKLLGYAPTQLPSGAPATRQLYRCYYQYASHGDHYVTNGAGCQGTSGASGGPIFLSFTWNGFLSGL